MRRGGRQSRAGDGARRARFGPLLVVAAAGAVLASCASSPPSSSPPATTHHSKGSTPTSRPADVSDTGPDCPLTGLPAQTGHVPQRSALAVKVDDYPTARPQTGLTAADIVFEEPVEGGITRYVAVFQCTGVPKVGPVRSARNIDIGILGELGHPLLVHVGGIQPVISDIQASPIDDFELGEYASVIQHPAGRVAPYDTYTSTTAIWQLRPTEDVVPQPVFTYSDAVPSGSHVKSVSIPFSTYSPVEWRYDAKTHDFLRYFGSAPDMLSNGVQNSAANVIVQFVHVTYGPWFENTEGGLEVQANLYTHASGPALVFRDGVEIDANWSRDALTAPTQFTTTSGSPIAMKPGRTWVELVPTTVNVTSTPASG